MRSLISGESARATLIEREAQEIEERKRCRCRPMLRVRCYLGFWLCGFCFKLRYS